MKGFVMDTVIRWILLLWRIPLYGEYFCELDIVM